MLACRASVESMREFIRLIAPRAMLLDEPVEDVGIDLIEAQEVRGQVTAELRVVPGLHHEAARQLPLRVQRPRVSSGTPGVVGCQCGMLLPFSVWRRGTAAPARRAIPDPS